MSDAWRNSGSSRVTCAYVKSLIRRYGHVNRKSRSCRKNYARDIFRWEISSGRLLHGIPLEEERERREGIIFVSSLRSVQRDRAFGMAADVELIKDERCEIQRALRDTVLTDGISRTASFVGVESVYSCRGAKKKEDTSEYTSNGSCDPAETGGGNAPSRGRTYSREGLPFFLE